MCEKYITTANKKYKKNFFSEIIYKFFKKEPKNQEELLEFINILKKKKQLDSETSNMLKGVIAISKKKVQDIMIPRPHIIFLKSYYTFSKCLKIIVTSSHSRFPVINHDKNFVEGFLIAKDLLTFLNNKKISFSLKNVLRPPLLVPESKSVDSMLKYFQEKRYHMAVVIDEFGSISGLITIEDILELIVGNIEDEYDHRINYKKNIQKIDNDNYIVMGLTTLKQFNKYFQTKYNDLEVDTIGGLLLKKIGKIPNKNEKIYVNFFIFTISVVNRRHIIQTHMQIKKQNSKEILKK
ncbi:CBS domain-containing protein [Buchnera aphidicola]|uniref:Magnesium and cobalt efflux protein CorC n=1 Tax=Buchnera aphidicola subsp. Tuberolachnus salignus TaxID=98804 RepID=A0A160SWY7_BUCTT|nr:CBS domain-containing protein [Buchnera aphidicola]CUR53260.1 Magnesium and cobalt efflux protein CorC [Buchnera aphidicola (Tuberolachnus salignus)]